MFIVIGIDADRQLVPLAVAIMEKENIGSWGWFFTWFREWLLVNDVRFV
jgi:hypothetical protein